MILDVTYLDRYKDIFRVKTNRLRVWDYSSPGYYFVTICVKDRKCILGEIKDRKVCLSDIGKIIEVCWKDLLRHFNNVRIDEFIVMPNHVHGIINIVDRKMIIRRDGACPVSTTLGNIIGSFKSAASKQIHQIAPSFAWQPRYYDHIIRDEQSLNTIREYMRYNPLKWDSDEENPQKR